MSAGFVVMCRMVAIVEQHKICKAADEITGMVIVGFFVGMDMLDIIEKHNDEQGHLLGSHYIEQGFAPIQDKGNDDQKAEGKILQEGQVKFIPFIFVQAFQVVHDRALLKIAADGRIGKKRQDIIGFAETVSDGKVSFPVVEFVMIFIVGGSPGESGESIEKSYPVVRDMVQQL